MQAVEFGHAFHPDVKILPPVPNKLLTSEIARFIFQVDLLNNIQIDWFSTM
jgi:hypothetical protein